MSKKRFMVIGLVLALVANIVLTGAVAVPAKAGVEPAPWKTRLQVRELKAITLELNLVLKQLQRVVPAGEPLDDGALPLVQIISDLAQGIVDFQPGDFTPGSPGSLTVDSTQSGLQVKKLRAIAIEVILIQRQLNRVVPTLEGLDENVLHALQNVRDAAQRIFDYLAGFFPPPTPTEPTITPTSGLPGTHLTITDPMGRIEQGDLCIFYPDGQGPDTGTEVTDVFISADGTTLTGTVPSVTPGLYWVAVRPTRDSDSRFTDLFFSVEL